MSKLKKYEVDYFYHVANEYRKYTTEESEIEKINFTNDFWTGLWSIKKHGGIIKININAPPYSGKSLTGIAINNEILKKIYKRTMTINDLDRDQIEYDQTIKNKKIHHTSRVIDEINPLGDTGENASIEKAFEIYASDVMAQREIDTINCSPTGTTDKNTLLFLEVFSTDKLNKVNHCKVYYKIHTGDLEYRQFLGVITINVKEALSLPWYKQYRQEKFDKMNLLITEGVFNPRRLEYAEIAYKVIQEYKNFAGIITLTKDTIMGALKKEYSKQVLGLSILGLPLASSEVMGVLNLYKEAYKLTTQINAIKIKLADPEIQEDTKLSTSLRNKNILLANARDKVLENAKSLEEELQRLVKLKDKYKRKVIEENVETKMPKMQGIHANRTPKPEILQTLPKQDTTKREGR